MFQAFYPVKYQAVGTDEDVKALVSDSCSIESDSYAASRRRGLSPFLVFVIALVCSILASLLGAWINRSFYQNLDSICTQHTSKYTPITEEVDITYKSRTYNGSFYKANIYRQDPSPEVDAAWDALGVSYNSIQLSVEAGEKAGLNEQDHVRISEKYGGGYFAIVEGLHHLHCLNLVRKALFYNFEYYHSRAKIEFSDADWAQKLHITHCLDILRQQLMCQPNIGIFGSNWVHNGTQLRPFVDFNTQHVCRNWDDIQEWARVRQVPDDKGFPRDYIRPPGEGQRILNGFP